MGFPILLVLFVSLFLNVSDAEQIQYLTRKCRAHTANLKQYGGIGDGVTSNTNAFTKAIADLTKFSAHGGSLLYVPPGKWLTGPFNLTSNFTLYIDKDAVLLGSQKESDYPLILPLPSYGRGRDAPGNRFSSLIFGNKLFDVVITGGNGVIDGQGETWWKKYKNGELNNTRPYLIEIMYSKRVQISNLTLINSPSWNVHPVYCRNVIIEHLTIIAPLNSPNTDGIDPDSCKNMRIRDCNVTSGDDCIAVKSGWDEYGIKFGMSTQNLSITRFTCLSPDSAVIALGSEMSGGIHNVRVDQIYAAGSQSGVRIKTGAGRGAYVKDIYVRNMVFPTMKYVFWMSGAYGKHADKGYDPNAYPNITNINYKNVYATNVTMVGNLLGIKNHPFTGICISNVTATMAKKSKQNWNCSDIEGTQSHVNPKACRLLKDVGGDKECDYPEDVLAIDKVVLKECPLVV